MDHPSEKWQTLYTSEQARWQDARQILTTLLPLIALALASVVSALVFVSSDSNRFINSSSTIAGTLSAGLMILIVVFPLIVGIVGIILIFRMAHKWFKDAYQPPKSTNTRPLILRRLFGYPPLPPPLDTMIKYPFVIIKDGALLKDEQAWVKWLGGPTSLVISDGNAVYVERGNRFSRVIGPGLAFLEKHEAIKEIVDLRPRVLTRKIEAWTKDGIKVEFQTLIKFRIGAVQGTVFPQDLPDIASGKDARTAGENLPLFPCDPICVKKAVEWGKVGREFVDGKEKLALLKWPEGVWGKVQGRLANYVSTHHLDELFVASKNSPSGQMLSSREREILRARLDQDLMDEAGITLIDLQITDFKLDPNINVKRVEKWTSEWKAKEEIRSAKADAEKTKAVETARAEAQRDLILQIADGLSVANEKTFADAVLLSLSGILEQSLGDPYAPAYLAHETLETLEKIQELLKKP